MFDRLSWPLVAAAVTIYVLGVVVYRLTLHPLSHFPGPKWTAITRYYEGYYDLVKGGQYTFKIAQLHKKYGPIVRISPYEVHVNDAAFFDTLYRQDAHYNKNPWAVEAFAVGGASITTVAHDLHRARRQPMSSFFSKARVASRHDMIHRHLSKLYNRLSKLADSETTFDFGAAVTALARDVANDYILNKSYNSLDRDDFDVDALEVSQGAGSVWRISKFIRFLGPMMQGVPIPIMIRLVNGPMRKFFIQLMELRDDTKRLINEATASTTDSKDSRTIVHDIVDSKLPPSEKEVDRVFGDVATVTGAGYETTASCMRLIFFHIFNNDQILQRLRAELATAGATCDKSLDLKTIEQLSYLTAILHEGLRLSPAIGTRMGRISPQSDILYDKWRIPSGTAVSMTIILMHMDEKLFPEPRRFNPDRWLEDGTMTKNDLGFAPFAKGARNCLGMHLAWAEMYTTVAEIVQRFDFRFEGVTAEDFECISDEFAIGTRCKGHVKATVAHHKD